VISGYHFSTGKLPLVSGFVAKEIEERGPLGCPEQQHGCKSPENSANAFRNTTDAFDKKHQCSQTKKPGLRIAEAADEVAELA
jgi:hypothetical protein